jgi:hypothetical protein
MKATKNGLAIQITTDENEKQKEKLAADQFFSSLLGFTPAIWALTLSGNKAWKTPRFREQCIAG